MAEKKPSRKAVALRYDQSQDEAPKIIAKGRGLVAEKIIELAEEQGIPLHKDSDLVEILSRLNINQDIPEETYLVVAEILAFIYRTNESYKKR
jgi:flagellar biosynthesis protein